MRIFETLIFKETIILTECKERDINDTKGNYMFTLVIGIDLEGKEQSIPADIEVTFPILNEI